MYRRISDGLAALMGLAVAGTSAVQAAPLLGHTATINAYSFSSGELVFSKTTTIGSGFEVTAADDPLFDVLDFIDIGADYITISGDGNLSWSDSIAHPSGFNFEIELEGGVQFLATETIDIVASGTFAFSSVTLLDERILIDGGFGDWGSFLFDENNQFIGFGPSEISITNLQADIAATQEVPTPGALGQLGLGLAGIGALAARRRNKAKT